MEHIEQPVWHAMLIIIFSFFACIAVLLRLWARRIQHLALTLSDYVIVLGLVSDSNADELECVINTSSFSHWLNRVSLFMVRYLIRT